MDPEDLKKLLIANQQEDKKADEHRMIFLAGQIAGLVEALEVVEDVKTITLIASKLRTVAHEVNKPPQPQWAPPIGDEH